MPLSKKSHKMLDQLITRNIADLEELRQKHRLTVRQMTRWVRGKCVSRALDSLAFYRARRTSILLTTSRLAAIEKLLAITTGKSRAGETRRRACMDLLRLTNDLAPDPRTPTGPAAQGDPAFRPWVPDTDSPDAAIHRRRFEAGVSKILECIGRGQEPVVTAKKRKGKKGR